MMSAMKVLVADDHKETLNFIQRGLTQAGHIVSTVDNGREALFRATAES
ncbi:response regulator transcription factor, partial [Anaerolineae bacterium CFX9]|nr:response regulator transcription factor [Anaerolineae bacterium CFX9]